jgi:replication initiation protein RepC
VLRGFVATPGFVLAIAPIFLARLHHSKPSWEELIRAAFDVRAALGISQHAWGQAVLLLGDKEAVVMLAAIAARHARGLVHSPGGLLRRMVELHQAGELRLDRTLFGLAHELTKSRHEPGLPQGVTDAGHPVRP